MLILPFSYYNAFTDTGSNSKKGYIYFLDLKI